MAMRIYAYRLKDSCRGIFSVS